MIQKELYEVIIPELESEMLKFAEEPKVDSIFRAKRLQKLIQVFAYE